jgi:hypothetical protein
VKHTSHCLNVHLNFIEVQGWLVLKDIKDKFALLVVDYQWPPTILVG